MQGERLLPGGRGILGRVCIVLGLFLYFSRFSLDHRGDFRSGGQQRFSLSAIAQAVGALQFAARGNKKGAVREDCAPTTPESNQPVEG